MEKSRNGPVLRYSSDMKSKYNAYTEPFKTVEEVETWVQGRHQSGALQGPKGSLPVETHYLLGNLGAVLSHAAFRAILSRETPECQWQVPIHAYFNTDLRRFQTGGDLHRFLFDPVTVQFPHSSPTRIFVANSTRWNSYAYRLLGRFAVPINIQAGDFEDVDHLCFDNLPDYGIWTLGNFEIDEQGSLTGTERYRSRNSVAGRLVLERHMREDMLHAFFGPAQVEAVAFDTLLFKFSAAHREIPDTTYLFYKRLP